MAGKKPRKKLSTKGIHPALLKMSEDHYLHYLKVLKWIDHNKLLVSEYRKQERNNIKGAIAKRTSCEGYIRLMRHYLKHGDWISNFYGMEEDSKVYWRRIA